MGSSADASARTRRASSCPRRRRPTMIGSVRVRPERERVSARRARAEARPTLLTPMFLTVAAAELAYFTADGVLLPALPRYVTGPLGSGNVAVGLVMGAFSLSAFFLRPWAGGIADRRGRRILMVTGGSVFALSVVGYLIASSVVVLAAMRLLTGVGEALFFVGALAANIDLAPPERRGEAMSFASLSLYIGIGAGPFIGEALITHIGFDAAWFASIGLAAVAVALALRLPAMRPAAEEVAPSGHRLVHRGGLLPGVILLAAVWGMAGFLTFVPLYVFDIGMSGAGLILGLFSAIVVLIRGFGARIPDRLGAARSGISRSAGGRPRSASWRRPWAGEGRSSPVRGLRRPAWSWCTSPGSVGGLPSRRAGGDGSATRGRRSGHADGLVDRHGGAARQGAALGQSQRLVDRVGRDDRVARLITHDVRHGAVRGDLLGSRRERVAGGLDRRAERLEPGGPLAHHPFLLFGRLGHVAAAVDHDEVRHRPPPPRAAFGIRASVSMTNRIVVPDKRERTR